MQVHDDECLSYNFPFSGFQFVALVRGEEEGGEGDPVCDHTPREQRDFAAGGGGEGGEV